jgi:hypothetical protein
MRVLLGAFRLKKSNADKCRTQTVLFLYIRINNSDWCLCSRWLNEEKNLAFQLNLTSNTDFLQMASCFTVTLFRLPHGARATFWEPLIWTSNEGATYIKNRFFNCHWPLRVSSEMWIKSVLIAIAGVCLNFYSALSICAQVCHCLACSHRCSNVMKETEMYMQVGRGPQHIVFAERWSFAAANSPLSNSSDSGKPSWLTRPGHRWSSGRARGIGFAWCTSNSCDPLASSPVVCLVWMQSMGMQGGWGEVAEKSLRVAHHDQAASLSLSVAVSGYTHIKRIIWVL